jgi:hypothetical protein
MSELNRSIGPLLGFIAISVLGALMLFNGVIMVVSPRKWFDLPSWLAGHGTMMKARYSTRWGLLQVRLLGAVLLLFLGVLLWIVREALMKRTDPLRFRVVVAEDFAASAPEGTVPAQL